MKKLFLLSLITITTFCRMQTFDPEEIFSKLSLRQKIAQLFVVAAISNEEKNKEFMERWDTWASYRLDHAYVEDLIKNYHIGGIIFYGKNTTAQEQVAISNHFQSLSKMPLLMSIDAETGLDDRLSEESVISYPCAMALGAMGDPKLVYKLGAELAKQLKKIGIHMTFSPVIDVNNNPANPIIADRAFGSEKELVTLMGTALMNGLQDNGLIACAKHFPGHGDTTTDSHVTLPKIAHSVERLEDIEFYPFKKLIDAGIKAIMLAHLEVPALEKEKRLASSLSYAIVTKLLQKKMGFKGLVITDALGMKGASVCAEPGKLELKALQAGNDILLCPVNTAQAIDYIEQAVYNGEISEKAINAKVKKVLQAKAWAFSHAQEDNQSIEEVLKSDGAKKLQEKLFSKGITLAKRSGKNPFDHENSKKAIIVIHDEEEDSKDLRNTIGSAIHSEILRAEIKPDAILKAEHIIITIHTMNRSANKNYGVSSVMPDLISNLKNKGKEITVVLFGSPYAIPLVQEADNILVAYENLHAAQKAVADILTGKKVATGILPVKIS